MKAKDIITQCQHSVIKCKVQLMDIVQLEKQLLSIRKTSPEYDVADKICMVSKIENEFKEVCDQIHNLSESNYEESNIMDIISGIQRIMREINGLDI